MKIGVIVPLHSYKEEFKKLREFGIGVCQFNAWDSSETLTEELQVNTFIQKFSKNVVLATGVSNVIPLNMTGYTYDGSDIINVYVNGLYDNSYTLNTSGETV